jgi:ferrous-iron efflux pump FieF
MTLSRSSLTRSAAFASIATALLLAGIKLWAVWRTDSTAMLGSLADTTLDLVASLATLVGVWVAAQPADRDHRFGHGKAEALAAMFQVVLIALSASAIALRAVQGLVEGRQTQAAAEGIGVSLVAIVATLALIGWQRHVVRRTGSLAIRTDSVHYQSDLLLNLAVIGALALDQLAGWRQADPLFGLAIAAWLGWGAWRASHAAVDALMDREWPEDRRQAFLAVLGQHPDVRGVHDLRTRTSGTHDFVQFHMAVDGSISVTEAHRIMDDVEARLAAHFPDVEVLIHPDPQGQEERSGLAAEELLPGVSAEGPQSSG